MPSILDTALAIQQIAAPTFAEHDRAAYVLSAFQTLGLLDVEMDSNANVYGRLRGAKGHPALMVSAHLDTVFPIETDLATRWDGDNLYGPGIGDNSLGVAGLITLAEILTDIERPTDVWFVANVGEEGLGDLNGMRTAVTRLQDTIAACVVIEGGTLGYVIHGGIGVERRRLIVETKGGHSWSSFGTPSAIHTLCQIISEITAWEVPSTPKTTFNVGRIEGGTSINTIAPLAQADIDMRSASPDALATLVTQLDTLRLRFTSDDIIIHSKVIGSRPPGLLDEGHPLVQAAIQSLHDLGWTEVNHGPASTDANIPLAHGIPTVCIGITKGHHAHRVDEYIETEPIAQGMRHLTTVTLAALDWVAREHAR